MQRRIMSWVVPSVFLGLAAIGCGPGEESLEEASLGTRQSALLTRPVTVSASQNSLTGGVPLNTGVDVVAGWYLTLTTSAFDTWSPGAGVTTNANGLYNDFHTDPASGKTFPVGALVGRIGSSPYFLVGTDYQSGSAYSGRLYLLFWDRNSADNSDSVTSTIRL
jgi:hypothetical protein